MKKIYLVMTILAVWGCSKDSELKKSVFLPDKENPDLPQYSEWGYNTFGAYYDRQVFISNNLEVPIKVISEKKQASLIFTGQKGSISYYTNPNPMSLTLIISDFTPSTYADLISLDYVTLELTDPKHKIIVNINGSSYDVNILTGSFTVSKAQNLLVDTKPEETILSGKFEFQGIVNGLPITLSDGRFDVGVGTYNFFKY